MIFGSIYDAISISGQITRKVKLTDEKRNEMDLVVVVILHITLPQYVRLKRLRTTIKNRERVAVNRDGHLLNANIELPPYHAARYILTLTL
jgi:hypothetical protein